MDSSYLQSADYFPVLDGAVVRRERFRLHLHMQGRYWQDAVTLGRVEMFLWMQLDDM